MTRVWTLLALALDAIAVAGQAITGGCLGSRRRRGGPPVRALLLAVLLVVAAQQPVAGVVFVLDGVLIGAGNQRCLAVAGVISLAVFLPAAWLVHAQHRGLVALWLACSLWLAARFVTLVLRARGSRWLVTGAIRR